MSSARSLSLQKRPLRAWMHVVGARIWRSTATARASALQNWRIGAVQVLPTLRRRSSRVESIISASTTAPSRIRSRNSGSTTRPKSRNSFNYLEFALSLAVAAIRTAASRPNASKKGGRELGQQGLRASLRLRQLLGVVRAPLTKSERGFEAVEVRGARGG